MFLTLLYWSCRWLSFSQGLYLSLLSTLLCRRRRRKQDVSVVKKKQQDVSVVIKKKLIKEFLLITSVPHVLYTLSDMALLSFLELYGSLSRHGQRQVDLVAFRSGVSFLTYHF
jgi:hypothetical protein